MNYYNRNGGFIDRFCAKHPRFGIPNLMKFLVIAQVIVFVLDLFTGDGASSLLFFSRWAILERGQIWRLATFIFLPNNSNPIYLLLSCYFYFWIASMLEREWGSAKFTLFYLSGMVLSVILGFLIGSTTIYYVNLTIFLILATYYGEMQVMFMFVLPIKMKWLAWLDLFLMAVDIIQRVQLFGWIHALLPIPAFINFFLFTWDFWSYKLGIARRRADPQVVSFKHAQKQAQKKARETGGYRHKCAVCGLTDQDDPSMEFRYCSKCDGYHCYCMNHINNHIHIRED